jgi:hypothetical protein
VLEEEVRKAQDQMRRAVSMQNRGQAVTEGASDEASSLPAEPLQADKLVEEMLSLLLNRPDLVPQVSRLFNPAWMEGLGGAEALMRLLDAHEHDGWQDAAQFMEECDDRTRNYLAGLLLTPPPVPGETTPEAYAERLVQNSEKRWKLQRLQFLSMAVRSEELSVEERMKYLREIQVIRREFPDLKP